MPITIPDTAVHDSLIDDSAWLTDAFAHARRQAARWNGDTAVIHTFLTAHPAF